MSQGPVHKRLCCDTILPGGRAFGVITFFLLFTTAGTSGAEEHIETLDNAMAQFESAEYEAAASLYLLALEEGTSTEAASLIHYNLGLSFVQLGRLGLATYHLTQAHYLDSGNGFIREALALVRAETAQEYSHLEVGEALTRGVPDPVFWGGVFHRYSLDLIQWWLLVFSWCGFGLLILRRRLLASGIRDAVTLCAVLSLVFLCLGAVYGMGRYWTEKSVFPGVVVSPQPQVLSAPDEEAEPLTESALLPGVIVLIESQRVSWSEIILADGRSGWTLAEDIRPFYFTQDGSSTGSLQHSEVD